MERQCKANVIIQQADGHRIPIGKLIHCLTSLTQQHRTTVDALMQSESASGSAASASATTATANGSSAASDSTAQRQQQICRKTAALLQEQRLRHIQRFLETEAALNSAHQLNVRCRRRCHEVALVLPLTPTLSSTGRVQQSLRAPEHIATSQRHQSRSRALDLGRQLDHSRTGDHAAARERIEARRRDCLSRDAPEAHRADRHSRSDSICSHRTLRLNSLH